MTETAPDRPSVAVVITTYDHAHFLETALRSTLTQTVPPDEVIVVDDGSHDHPEEVTGCFPTVRLIRQPNAGLAAARNTGWRAATSELVVFLDADDRLLPDAVRRNLERLVASPDAGFAYGAYVNVDASNGHVTDVHFVPAVDGYPTFLRGNPIGMHATVMYRRARLDAVGGFDPGLRACEDYDLYLRMAHRFPVSYGPDVLAEYWHHGSNMSLDAAMMLRSALLVLRRHEGEARRSGASSAYREGLVGWKRFYVGQWTARARGAARTRRFDGAVVRQGVALARQAPGTGVRLTLASSRVIRRVRHGLVALRPDRP